MARRSATVLGPPRYVAHARAHRVVRAGGRRLRVLFVLTIRSDSLPKLQAQPALQAMSPVLFSLPAMPVSEFKAVIEGPAERHTQTVKPLVIAPQLTEQLVVDAQGADALPLLALTLEWLYREFTNAQGTRLGHHEYQRLGGVRGVISMAVDRAFERPGTEPAIPAERAGAGSAFAAALSVHRDRGPRYRRLEAPSGAARRHPESASRGRCPGIAPDRTEAASRRFPSTADRAEPVEVVEVAHEHCCANGTRWSAGCASLVRHCRRGIDPTSRQRLGSKQWRQGAAGAYRTPFPGRRSAAGGRTTGGAIRDPSTAIPCGLRHVISGT